MNKMLEPLNTAMWEILVAFWPFWCFFFVVLVVRLFTVVLRERRLARSGIAEIDRMEGITFEQYLETLFRSLGYAVQRTPASGDYGADLIIHRPDRRVAVQAKRYSKNVGVAAVQEIVAAQKMYRCDSTMVVTNQYYTKQAQQLAHANNVILWDRTKLVEAILTAQAKRTSSALPQENMANQ